MKRISFLTVMRPALITAGICILLILLIIACSAILENTEETEIYTWTLHNVTYDSLKKVINKIEEKYNGDINSNEVRIILYDSIFDNKIVFEITKENKENGSD